MFQEPPRALAHATNLVSKGVPMLDVGAESTRPGAKRLEGTQEWARLEPVLSLFGQRLSSIPLSLDTRHPLPAERGLALGVAALNDVTGFSNPALLELASCSSCGLIAMRSRLQEGELVMPEYGGAGLRSADAAIRELALVRDRLLDAGIAPERILLDPGFGFGTTFQEDLALWAALPALPSLLDWPVQRFCIGVSRKRFLAWRANQPDLPPRDRDALTWKAHHEALELGYRVLRTHTSFPGHAELPGDLQY